MGAVDWVGGGVVARLAAGELWHPFDQRGTGPRPAALERVSPGDLGGAVRLGVSRRPEIYALLGPICAAFGLEEPELYLAKRAAHGCPFGQTGQAVVVAEDLVDQLTPDELTAVLAHQCGHLLLGHAWSEAAELSADRAAAAYLGDADAITRAIFRSAGRADEATALAVRVREIQAWTSTPGFARLNRSTVD